LVWSKSGKGSTVLIPTTNKAKVLTVRYRCTGPGSSRIRSVGGGLILGTSGCDPSEVAAATFTRSKLHNPNQMTLTVDPGVSWQVEVWAGAYVVQQPQPQSI
jgi:hypothetical protein